MAASCGDGGGILVSYRVLLFLGFLFLVSCANADTWPLAPGSGVFQFSDPKGPSGKPIAVAYYLPNKWLPKSPILFVMHGIDRNSETYRDIWIPYAEQLNALLICPCFSEEAYPGSSYANGALFAADKSSLPPEAWGLMVIEHLFDFIRGATGAKREGYWLYGHSAGAQFVHRLVLLLPESRCQLAIAANAGAYTMPRSDVAFPLGLMNVPAKVAPRREAFSRRMIVLLGEKDTDPNHKHLSHSSALDKQGLFRLERGQNFFATAQAAAKDDGVVLAWKQVVVPGAEHSNKQMAVAAADIFKGEK